MSGTKKGIPSILFSIRDIEIKSYLRTRPNISPFQSLRTCRSAFRNSIKSSSITGFHGSRLAKMFGQVLMPQEDEEGSKPLSSQWKRFY